MSSYAERQRAARDAEIAKLVRLGWTNVRIARRMEVSERLVSRVRKDAGLEAQRRAPITTEQRARAECLLADGASQAEVARSVGATRDQIRRAFPGHAWTREQMTEGEHATGIRAHTAPVIRRSRRRDQPGPEAVTP